MASDKALRLSRELLGPFVDSSNPFVERVFVNGAEVIDTALAEAREQEREAAREKIAFLERMLHENLHNIPKSSEDCRSFCFITLARYPDGTYGHCSTGGSLDPAEAMMAVYGDWAVKQEVIKVLDAALATYSNKVRS